MSRRFCLLPQGFSDAVAKNCKLHRHLREKEAEELHDAGEIEKVTGDLVTKVRFVVRALSPVVRRSIVLVPGASLMERSVGAWEEHAGEVKWAARKIQAYAPVRTWVTLRRLFYDADGLRWSVKPLSGLPNVEVLFRNLDFEPKKSLQMYRMWMPHVGAYNVLPKSVAAMKFQKWRQALIALDRNWNGIVSAYRAGSFSEALTQSKPSDLPSYVFRETIEALI